MIPTLIADVERWLQPAPTWGQRRHFRVGGLHAYLRVNMRAIDGHGGLVLDLADVTLTPELRGRGLFSMLLAELERVAQERQMRLVVEHIINEIVVGAVQRRGYTLLDGGTYVNNNQKQHHG